MKIDRETLDIPNDPTPWVIVRPNSTKEWAVLWLQGWTSNIASHLEGIERMSKTSGAAFTMIDYAGHGEHPVELDTSTKARQLNEVVAAYDKLIDLGYQNVIVIGGSFGGYMAALLAGERNPAAVVLRAPANYPDDELEFRFDQTLRWEDIAAHRNARKQDKSYFNTKATKAIESYNGPVYVLEHELDSIVPPQMVKTYFNHVKHGNYLRVPNTEHSPKLMPNPKKHYAYIEHLLVSIIKAVQLTP